MQKQFLTMLFFCLFIVASDIIPQVGNQTPIDPESIPQFVDPLPHFAGLRVNAKTATDVWIKAVPSDQVAVSTGTVLSTGTVGVDPGVGKAHVWAYQISTDGVNFTPPLWPAFTIETVRGHALNVHYSNELYGETYDKVGLVVDQTIHWANPLDDMGSTSPYEGNPPICVHLHGGEVPPQSDGGPDSWFTPGNAITGHAYNGDAYYYPNTQEAATLWFHDHGLGVTRLNVYAGMAGFYFLRDPNEDALKLPGWSGDGMVKEGDGGFRGNDKYLPEIEMAIQDRMFDSEGKLYFPNDPPNPTVHPVWTPEFIGNVITVNGKTWPFQIVAPRRYRFRILNGSNSRFYNLSFPTGGPTITQIGTDGGFLDHPVDLGTGPLLIAPGERADVIIDFTPFDKPLGYIGIWTPPEFILGNDANAPYPDGDPVETGLTDRILKFIVDGKAKKGGDLSDPSVYATLKTNVKLTDFAGNVASGVTVAKTRQLTLNEVLSEDGPLEVLVNNTKWDGSVRNDFTDITNSDGSHTYYSELMDEGTTEIWQIINLTADAHPIHLHLVQFQLMSRQPFDQEDYESVYNASFTDGVFMPSYGPPLYYTTPNSDGAIGGNPAISSYLIQGEERGAEPNERGWKDTFIMYPQEVTTVIARWAPTDEPATTAAENLWFAFDPNGGHGYVWHCHIIDHEDNEMMRPYAVNPNPNNPLAKSRFMAVSETAENFELGQNYPNPFNPSTIIRFTVPKDGLVTLKVYDVLGQEVGTLINQVVPQGKHQVNFDGTGLASGMYIYKLTAGSYSKSYKMVLAK